MDTIQTENSQTQSTPVQVSESSSTAASPSAVVVPTASLISFGHMLSEGWLLMVSKYKIFLGLIVASLVGLLMCAIVISLASATFLTLFVFGSSTMVVATVIGLAAFVVMMWYFILVYMGVIRGLLSRDTTPGLWSHMKESRKHVFPFMLVTFYVGLITNIGFYAFLIPGFIAFVYFMMAKYVFVDEGLRGFTALARSVHLTHGYWWIVFGRMMAFWALMLVVVIAPIIGMSVLPEQSAQFLIVEIVGLVVVGLWFFSSMVVLFRSLQSVNTVEAFQAHGYTRLIFWLRATIIVIVVGLITMSVGLFSLTGSMIHSGMQNDGGLRDAYEMGLPSIPVR